MGEERPRASQKKEERKVHTYYEMKEGKLTRRLRKCPRCGSFMASHKGMRQRWACGSCGYTEFAATKSR